MAPEAFRHELKFFVGPHQYHPLRQRLRHFLRPDPHAGPGGEYRITSLYFDDAADSALFEKLAGVEHRQKIRIRVYDGRDNVIMLEKKLKHGEGVGKERIRIDRRIYAAMGAGDPQPLMDAGDPLLTEVAWLMTNRLLRPKVIVDYVREAYLHPLGNVRITFDKSLRSGLTNLDLFRKMPYAPAPIDGLTILEVKYDAFLPRPVQDLLQTDSLTRQSASKYVLCRTLTKTNAWEDQ
ncbi:MAG TPA: polyphosphate polymerase domain-containing protein [Symbiobacteriaceae bacterium]|nr:polyphosphate polymerase domain-containing protein [Symbiobacteriaceae bacterium]